MELLGFGSGTPPTFRGSARIDEGQDEGQHEGQKVVDEEVGDGQNTLFQRIVQGPFGCHLLSLLVPRSRFRGSGKKFFKLQNEV